MIGETVSHYSILEKLGEGGMGVVYKALDTKLDRHVAIKFLPTQLMSDKTAKTRFIQEAKAASALNHSNIAVVHDIDETPDGQIFIVMAYYDGQTLKDKLEAGPLAVDEAANIVSQIASALAAAHEKDIVHRDIKPANILITERGEAKLADFGLAKLVGQTGLTKTGVTVGTIHYMSPEQASGQAVGHQSDIFSLGVVLYELLAGETPFRGEHETAVLYGIMHSQPEPLTKHRSDLPEDLERIANKALEKNTAARYQSAAEILDELTRFRRGTPRGSYGRAKVRTIPRRTVLIAAISILGLIGGFLGYSHYSSLGPKDTGRPRKMIAVLPFENLGQTADDYFADGMAEEITARLTGIRELGVIGRASAMQYKKTQKSVREIGDELGVDYIVKGSVRWQAGADHPGQVRVTPQVIQVSDGTHLWAEVFDRPAAEIFQIQTDIASRVAEALDLSLLEREQQILGSVPTDNFDAYTYYLRGVRIHLHYSRLSEAQDMLEKAVELDNTFALAHARLSLVHSEFFHIGHDRTPERALRAKEAADMALSLQPDLPEAWVAQGLYNYMCRLDYGQALKDLSIAQKSLPQSADVSMMVGWVLRRQGKWAQALENLQRASVLDPRAAFRASEVGRTYHVLRNYQDAERHYDRAISISVGDDKTIDMASKSELYLTWNGDMKRASKALSSAPDVMNGLRNDAFFASIRLSMLEANYQEALDKISLATFEAFYDQFYYTPKVQLQALVHGFMGDLQKARAYHDSTRILLEAKLAERSDDARFHSSLGIAYAGLNRKEDAMREGKLATELLPVTKEAWKGYHHLVDLARIYTMVGENDAAIEQLGYLLSVPGELSVALLRLDPTWAPLHNDPGFKALLKEYSEKES